MSSDRKRKRVNESGPAGGVGRPRVLVVEDDAEMNRLVSESLSDRYEVISAFDGREGLDKALSHRPALVVSDIMMPVMGGVEMVAEMRRRPELQVTPILLLSAKADDELVAKLLDDGAQDYVVKPFSEKVLAVRVRNLILAQQAREEAEAQKRLLQSLFMQSPTLLVVLRGPDHVVEMVNPPTLEVWGLKEEEALGRPLLEVRPELRDQVFPGLLDEVYRTGIPYAGKEMAAKLSRGGRAGEPMYFNFVYTPFRDAEGRVDGIFVIATDVTEQFLARQQVNALRVAAESANRAKDEFLAMLGHELRNPLSPILTALQLIKLRGPEGLERARTVIERQVNHLMRLVDDLLDVSRIARGKVELKSELIDIADVVARALEMASPILEQRAHMLNIEVPRRRLSVHGDATRLSQVVANLVTNAAKYTAPGGQVTVRAEEVDGQVVLGVRDTGFGIAPDILPHIFDLFVQERQAIDRSQGGLGIGLAIVRNLIERHGGSVSAHSDGPGRGSEFIVRLPLVVRASEPALPPALPPGTVATAPPRAGAPRVLVVDDNEDAADTLAEVLTEKGYDTRVANDGPTALRVAAEYLPDIAFLDIGLPVMDGYELASHLRALPGLADVRLIAITGYGQESDRLRALEAGFQQHLVKPVDLRTIEEAIASS